MITAKATCWYITVSTLKDFQWLYKIFLWEVFFYIRKGYKNHSVSRHYDLVHNRDPTVTLFMGMESFSSHWRGRFKVRELSKIETKWIYLLKSYVPYGLNVDWDVNCFSFEQK